MARSLAAANVEKAIRAALGQASDPSLLPPGHMRLYSHYQPSLLPGLYGIEAEQTIQSVIGGVTSKLTVFNYSTPTATNPPTSQGTPNAPTVLQQFNVVAPQFQIDPKAVNSVYPPPGHTDEGRILPHIVFNDPHIPWDRTLLLPQLSDETSTSPKGEDRTPNPEFQRDRAGSSPLTPGAHGTHRLGPSNKENVSRGANLFPWIALVVFDADELKLTPTDEAALGIPLVTAALPTPATGSPQQVKPSPGQVATPGAYPMTVGDYLTQVTSRINYEAGFQSTDDQSAFKELQSSAEPTSIIFPTKNQANLIFNPTVQFVCTSHVREVNKVGFPDSGAEEQGLFSVCISRRTGPTVYATSDPNPAPVTQVVHLVSLEYVAQTTLVSDSISERVGMVSLYSWTYLSVPPNPINFKKTMTNLADTMQMLRPPEVILQSILKPTPSLTSANLQTAAQKLHDRLSLGYTISRWRTAVGQETVGFTRGPLTPLATPWKPSVAGDWPGSSNSGKDYQILDRDLGVMDLSYSSAWQLGKLMAVSDNIFNSALLRFRSLVHEFAASETRKEVNAVRSKISVLHSLGRAVDELHATTNGSRRPARLVLPTSDRVEPPFSDPRIAPVFNSHLVLTIDAQTAAGQAIYSDYNLGQANNSDWEIIHKWISDKLFLGGIPAHYLIPDPSLLPSEALRFFYIDSAWLDCFIDGALSVANHLEPVDDKVRRRIKDVYNVYLRNNIDPAPVKPPVPRYGFLLRSALLKVMPDLRVTVTCRTGSAPNFVADTSRLPLLRLTKMDDYTILALLDCLPEEIFEINFAQPPHQQRYVAAAELVPTPSYNITTLYTSNAPEGVWPPLDKSIYPAPTEMAKWYDPSSRCLDVLLMTVDITTALNKSGNFTAGADSVNLALELNDPCYQLQILPPLQSDPSTAVAEDRQLWVGVDVDDPDDPIAPAQPVVISTPIIHPLPPHIPRPPKAPTAPRSSSALVEPDGSQLTVKLPVSPRVPRHLVSSPITVHPASTKPRPIPRGHALNLSASRVITRATAPASPTSTVTPQFNLEIHPDYRGPAPLPYTAPDGSKTFSAKDYIPTATIYLFDLIFSIQLKTPTTPAPYPLVSVSIFLPTDTTPTSPEPLLQAPYTGAGAKMLSNKRLIPFLTAAPGTLQVQLLPRAALPGSSTVSSIPPASAADASCRLAQCRIAATVTPQPVSIVGVSGTISRGLCNVQLTETYLLPSGTTESAVSEWPIIKQDGGDVDPQGNQV